MVVGMLRLMKLNVISFTAELAAVERGKLLGNFNDKHRPVNALVVPSTMTLSGMNMHQACNWGIMVGLDESSAKTKQAFGRIHRIGQTKEVYWFVIIMRGSHQRAQERACHTKEMNTVSVMSPISTDITTDLRTMMCFEVAREQYGAPMSTYTTAAHHDKIKSVADYEQDWVDRFSTFYTLLASLGLKSIAPTGDDVEDKANVIRLCDRMQRLSKCLHAVCLMIECDNDGNRDEVLRFNIECGWDEILGYVARAESQFRKGSLMEDIVKKYAFRLARLLDGSGSGIDDPNVKTLYNNALQIQDLTFNPPPTPEAISDALTIRQKAEDASSHQASFLHRTYHLDPDMARDPEGLYDLLGCDPEASFHAVFIAYAEQLRKLGPVEDCDNDDEVAAREEKQSRLDEAAGILCVAR